MLSKIDDETEILDARTMTAQLLEDSERMAEIFKLVFAMSEREGEHGLSDFLASRQDAHRKHSWMLRATLK